MHFHTRNARTWISLTLTILAVCGCSSSGSSKAAPSTTASSTSTTTTGTATTTSPPTRPKAKLEFREVLGQFLASGPPCTLTSTSDATQAILFDRKRTDCYLVGPVLLTGAAIDKATVQYDSTSSQWAVNLRWGNDDFITKIGNPLVNRQIAIVLNDVVQSAPTINPGITGHAIEITGDFSRADAVKAAAAIAGVAPSAVHVDPTTG